jgi:hypothetical protein
MTPQWRGSAYHRVRSTLDAVPRRSTAFHGVQGTYACHTVTCSCGTPDRNGMSQPAAIHIPVGSARMGTLI